jgi:hypothetical protein
MYGIQCKKNGERLGVGAAIQQTQGSGFLWLLSKPLHPGLEITNILTFISLRYSNRLESVVLYSIYAEFAVIINRKYFAFLTA